MSLSLPEGWVETTLGEVCSKPQYGYTTKSSTLGNLKFLRTTDITKSKLIWDNVPYCLENPKDSKKYLLENGDIVISRAGSVGFSFLIENIKEDAVFASYLIRFKPYDKDIDKKYLSHFLKSPKYWQQITDVSAGVAVQNINAKKLGLIKLPLPPLTEQKQIAKKLDKLLARVERIKTVLDNAPAKIKRFRQSVLASAVGGEFSEGKNWENLTIDDILENIRYGTSKKCSYDDTLTPVLRIPNIKDSKINTEDIKSASFNEKEFETLALKVGDILVIRSNGSIDLVGKNVVVTKEHENYIFAGYLIRVRLNLTLAHPKYIHYVLSSPQIREVINITAKSTSGVNNLNSKEIGSFKVSLPPLKEQKAIVKKVETLFAIADKMEANIAEAQKRVDKLTQSILAKAFCGEL